MTKDDMSENFGIIYAPEEFRNDKDFLAQLGAICVNVNLLRFVIKGKAVYLLINPVVPFKTIEELERMVPEITARLEKIEIL
jgi:hypothetical protein